MIKRFLKDILKNICVYLLTISNLIYSIQNDRFGLLMWLSLLFSGASLVLSAFCAARGEQDD